MNRADHVHLILRLEALAAEAKRRAAHYRDELAADARAELTEQGTAPTWRLTGIGTVTLPVTTERPVINEPPEFVKWVEATYPDEIETVKQVRPAFQNALLARLVCDDGDVVDPATGAMVPGMTVREGGQPGALTIRASSAAKSVVSDAAVGHIDALLDGQR